MMGVRFTSTGDRSVDVDFSTAIISGQPSDGGLYIPVEIPRIDLGPDVRRDDVKGLVPSLRGFDVEDTVPALARTILSPWIGDHLTEALDWESVFSFPIRIVRLAGDSDLQGTNVVELFHGPTGSFKDFGARFLAACLKSVNRRSGRPAVVLVATSGDTGSAVADAFSSTPGVGVVILYPEGRVSPVQEAQLTRARDGVWAYAIDGSFDDCQRSVKHILADGVAGVDLISANSINIGRLLPQMLFYVYGAGARASAPTYVVPCGNLGNLTAGLMARSCAIPGARFVAATNTNDYFARVLGDPAAAEVPLKGTLSNSMDVAHPSNLERINALYARDEQSRFLSAHVIDDGQTVDMMGRVFRETGYIADPHTSVALAAAVRDQAIQGKRETESWSVIATADPAKYRPLVELITGAEVDGGRFRIPAAPPHAVIGPEDVSEAVDWVASQVT